MSHVIFMNDDVHFVNDDRNESFVTHKNDMRNDSFLSSSIIHVIIHKNYMTHVREKQWGRFCQH